MVHTRHPVVDVQCEVGDGARGVDEGGLQIDGVEAAKEGIVHGGHFDGDGEDMRVGALGVGVREKGGDGGECVYGWGT